jgi:hypothetical protein
MVRQVSIIQRKSNSSCLSRVDSRARHRIKLTSDRAQYQIGNQLFTPISKGMAVRPICELSRNNTALPCI